MYVLMMESACSPLREYETVRAAAPVLKPGWKWNRFQQRRNGGGEGDGGGQGVGDGEDSAGRARRAFEDDWTTVWGGVGGVASGGGGVSGNGRYIECNIERVSERC